MLVRLFLKYLGIPIGALTAVFSAGIWVNAIESQAKQNADNISKIETSQQVMDQRVWQMLLGQLAIQRRLGVTEEDLKRMAEKAMLMKNPAFKPPVTKNENPGG